MIPTGTIVMIHLDNGTPAQGVLLDHDEHGQMSIFAFATAHNLPGTFHRHRCEVDIIGN